MKLWTLTEEYAVVMVDGEFIKADVQYFGNKKYIEINGGLYFTAQLA